MLDEIAWLFNIRGTDIPFNPLFFSYCYISLEKVQLFMNEAQASDAVRAHLSGVTIENYASTLATLEALDEKVLASSNSPAAIVNALKNKQVVTNTPVGILKAYKNDTEIEGMLLANVRSAVCHVKALKYAEGRTIKYDSKLLFYR